MSFGWSLARRAVVVPLMVSGLFAGACDRHVADSHGPADAAGLSDAQITAAVTRKFEENPNLAALQISVRTSNGVVRLRADRDSTEDQRELAVLLARQVPGVRDVDASMK